MALSVDQIVPDHPEVLWHSAFLNTGWLSLTGYYWIPETWGHTSSDASGEGPCKHATRAALAVGMTRTWAVAISGTVPDREGVAASLPLRYARQGPWVHTADAEVMFYLLRHVDRETNTVIPTGESPLLSMGWVLWNHRIDVCPVMYN